MNPNPVPTCIICDVALTTRTAPRGDSICASCRLIFDGDVEITIEGESDAR